MNLIIVVIVMVCGYMIYRNGLHRGRMQILNEELKRVENITPLSNCKELINTIDNLV